MSRDVPRHGNRGRQAPILRMEQVMWTATGRSVGVNTSLVRRNVYNELCRFVKLHFMDGLAHPVQARALVAQHRIPALFAGFPQGCLQFGRFAVGNVKHSLAFPDCAAAKLFHVFGEDDFVTAFLQQGNHFARQCLLHRRFFGSPIVWLMQLGK